MGDRSYLLAARCSGARGGQLCELRNYPTTMQLPHGADRCSVTGMGLGERILENPRRCVSLPSAERSDRGDSADPSVPL